MFSRFGVMFFDQPIAAFRNIRSAMKPGGRLAFVCWSPLGGYRKAKDESKFDPFRALAKARGVSYQQIVLAWELAKGGHVFVIPGAHRPETILDSLKSGDLKLTPEELATLG